MHDALDKVDIVVITAKETLRVIREELENIEILYVKKDVKRSIELVILPEYSNFKVLFEKELDD